MSGELTVTSNGYSVATTLEQKAPAKRSKIIDAVTRGAALVPRYIAQNKITGGGLLEPRTGQLRRALYATPATDSGTAITATVGVDSAIAPYGRIQELGGTIVPTQAGHLTVPLDEAKTSKGVASFSARQVIANPFNFGFAGTFVAKDVLFGKLSEGTIVPLFALKRSVTLPARGYLSSSLQEKAPDIRALVASAVQETA